MAKFCRPPSLGILVQNCIRNDFTGPEIQNFLGDMPPDLVSHAIRYPDPLVGVHSVLFFYVAQGHCCPPAPLSQNIFLRRCLITPADQMLPSTMVVLDYLSTSRIYHH